MGNKQILEREVLSSLLFESTDLQIPMYIHTLVHTHTPACAHRHACVHTHAHTHTFIL